MYKQNLHVKYDPEHMMKLIEFPEQKKPNFRLKSLTPRASSDFGPISYKEHQKIQQHLSMQQLFRQYQEYKEQQFYMQNGHLDDVLQCGRFGEQSERNLSKNQKEYFASKNKQSKQLSLPREYVLKLPTLNHHKQCLKQMKKLLQMP